MAKKRSSRKKKASQRKKKVNKVARNETATKVMSRASNPDAVAKVKVAKSAGNSSQKIGGWIDTIKSFLSEAKFELKKVTWPTKKETVATTSVVLVVVFIVALFLGVVDLGLGKIIGYFLK